jgi:hypothetical protein
MHNKKNLLKFYNLSQKLISILKGIVSRKFDMLLSVSLEWYKFSTRQF